MKITHTIFALTAVLALLPAATPDPLAAAELVNAKDGSGVVGYKDTPIQPWSGFHVHDPDRPAPKRVDTGKARPPVPAPSDAIVLFDGKNLALWEKTDWQLVDGAVEATGHTGLTTKQGFGSFQLHVEWMTPNPPQGRMMDRGNNGLYLHGLYEIQIYDSWTEKIYPDGQAAAIYGQTPPLVNACRPPGEWQSYDVVFTAPVFDGDKLTQPARVTVIHNGVLVHHNQEIYGVTGHRSLAAYKSNVARGPVVFSGHNNPVRFRNIWIRPL